MKALNNGDGMISQFENLSVHGHHHQKRRYHAPVNPELEALSRPTQIGNGFSTPSAPQDVPSSKLISGGANLQLDRDYDCSASLDALPSVPLERSNDQERFRTQAFHSFRHRESPIPKASTDFVCIDDGCSNPKFIRASSTYFPVTDEVTQNSEIPLSVLIQPFAPLRPEDSQVPLVDFSSESNPPHRCTRCRAYINPFMQFINGGNKVVCNHCLFATNVSEEYFSIVDSQGIRQDISERPELMHGTVDFAVPPSYWLKEGVQPQPLNLIFLVDVSQDSFRKGLPGNVALAIKQALYGPDGLAVSNPFAKIAILSVDRAIYFHDLSLDTAMPRLLVVSDVEDAFLPLKDGLFVDPVLCRDSIEKLLDNFTLIFKETCEHEIALGASIEACIQAFADNGGTIIAFASSLSTWGPGALRFREHTQLYGTEGEKVMFTPQTIYWNQLSQKCVKASVGINFFLFPTGYIDVASIGTLATTSGGDMFMFANYAPKRDNPKFFEDLSRLMSRTRASQVHMTVRCSTGLRVTGYQGNFVSEFAQEIEFGNMDSQHAVLALLKHEQSLDEKLDVHIQAAILYTSTEGQRRVRCLNLSIRPTKHVLDVIRTADLDVLMGYLTRKAVSESVERPLSHVRRDMQEICVKILANYRKHAKHPPNSSRLILPENLKTFPCFVLALSVSRAFRSTVEPSDIRCYSMRIMHRMSARELSLYLYPQILSLHDMDPEDGFPDESNLLRLPRLVRATYQALDLHGLYLLDNGLEGIIHIQKDTVPELLQDVFDVMNIENLDPYMNCLPKLETRISVQIRNTLTYLNNATAARSIKPVLSIQSGSNVSHASFLHYLIEDKMPNFLGYKEFLLAIHERLQTEARASSYKKIEESLDITSLWQGRW